MELSVPFWIGASGVIGEEVNMFVIVGGLGVVLDPVDVVLVMVVVAGVVVEVVVVVVVVVVKKSSGNFFSNNLNVRLCLHSKPVSVQSPFF